jgi:hypothetical protein
MTSAILWDSLQPGNEAEVKETPAFQNFTNIVEAYNAEPELKLTGIQNNAHSCLDYVLQEAYKDAGIENEITQAKNANDLRFAEVKQIAKNHENIHDEVIDQLTMHANGEIDFGGKVEQNQIATLSLTTEQHVETFLEKFVDKKQTHAITQEDKDWQITFDAVFSEHLQELYQKNPDHKIGEEATLVKEARRRAMLEIGFFPPADKNNKDAHKPENTNSNSFNFKK